MTKDEIIEKLGDPDLETACECENCARLCGEKYELQDRLYHMANLIEKREVQIQQMMTLVSDQAATILKLTTHLTQKSRQISNLQDTVESYQRGSTETPRPEDDPAAGD